MTSGLSYDLRYAARSLARRPGFTVTAVFILALGIGSVTVVFSALDAVVLKPLPFPEAERLVWVWSITNRGTFNSTSAEDYYDYRERCSAFGELGAHAVWKPGCLVSGAESTERVVSTTASASLFSALGVQPAMGRLFAAAEEVDGGPEVVVVSHRYWRSRMGADPAALGTTLRIDGVPRELIGVMPEGFEYPAKVDMWFPMRRGGGMESGRGNNNFFMIGRLKDRLSLEEAQAQLGVVAAAIAREHPDSKEGWGAQLIPLHEKVVGAVKPIMVLLMAAVAVVLLIVCGNLSSLMLARVISRSRELAVRSSIGGSRWAVGRQILLESLVLAAIGSLVGFALALLGIRFLAGFGQLAPRLDTIQVNASVLGIAALVSLASGLLAGLAPALHGTRVSLVDALKSGEHGTEGIRGLRLRSLLVVGQVALSVVLLIGAGLLLRSLIRLNSVDPGMQLDQVLTFDLQLPADRYPDSTESTAEVIDQLLTTIRAQPGVARAAVADQLPLFGGPYNGLYLPEKPPSGPEDYIPATRRIVSEDFFAALGIPVLQGRSFTSGDRIDSTQVIVISRALAETAFPGGEAVGRTLVLPWRGGLPLQVIGVVGDVRDFGLDVELRPSFYMPIRQFPDNDFRVVVKAAVRSGSLVPTLRQAVDKVEPGAALHNVGTMQEWLSESMAGPRFTTGLLASFALVALVLSATGLYGVMAFMVARRTREVGIRVALGAGPRQIIRRFLWLGLKTAAAGLAVGLVLAPLASGLLRSVLFATDSHDLLTYVVVTAVLLAVILLASLLPALRALRVDPAQALRAE